MRVPRDNLLPEPGTSPSETSLMMAAAVAHEQGVLKDFRNPDQPSAMSLGADYMRRKIKEEEDPTITKYPARTIEPGERVIDRELGITSLREIRRL